VLPASQSRAAWLAVICSTVYLLILRHSVTIKIRFSNFSFIHKGLVFLLITIILFAGSIGAYFLKKDSADGRILIWKVTLNMIADNPFTGMGINGFKANYMNYQAEYFKSHPDSDEAMLAGDTNYSFNELLQQTAEHGAIGGLLIVFIFISAFLTNSIKKNRRNIESNLQNNRLKEMKFIAISKAIILSIFIFSMFSYPAQILPIKISLIFALAYLSNNQKSFFSVPTILRIKKLSVYGIYVGKGIVLCLIAVSALYGIRLLKTQAKALKDWEFAFVLYSLGNYDSSIKEYALVMPVLRCNGDFLTNYGKALSMAGKHQKAIEVLQQAITYYPNTIVYTALGDSYKETGQIKKAESAYLQAWHMNPSRFYPKYLLAKLYDETGQPYKAIVVAKELLEKQIKISSTAIEEIKTEMRKIVGKNTGFNSTFLDNKKNGGNRATNSSTLIKCQFW
jgi:tetratricopeptide (TPR) repeat protein